MRPRFMQEFYHERADAAKGHAQKPHDVISPAAATLGNGEWPGAKPNAEVEQDGT